MSEVLRHHAVAILVFHVAILLKKGYSVAIVSQYTMSAVLIMQRKQTELQNLILEMLHNEATITVPSVLVAAQLTDNPTERRAVQRALASLTRQGLIVSKGAARSRVYVLAAEQPETQLQIATNERGDVLNGIPISAASRALHDYISSPLTQRTPVGYDQEFLRSYVPNATFYLAPEQRGKLHEVGQVEAAIRPAGTYARNILDRLLIDLSWNSSRLEGNTYSLLETKRLIELGKEANDKNALEAQMILNHKAAIEYIVESAEDERITSHEVCSIHALLSENLLENAAASGRLRSIVVGIGGSTYLPLENPHLINEMFDLFIEKINLIEDPFEQSLFSIIHLSYLQAFEDVNKRTARLVANIPMVKKNLRPLSFVEVDKDVYVRALLGVYEKNDISLIRDLYMWAYDRSSRQYTAVQRAIAEPNLLKLRYRIQIQEIVRSIILEKIKGDVVVAKIRELIEASDLPEAEHDELFNIIENEIVSLHDGNIARFKVRPSEYRAWKEVQ